MAICPGDSATRVADCSQIESAFSLGKTPDLAQLRRIGEVFEASLGNDSCLCSGVPWHRST